MNKISKKIVALVTMAAFVLTLVPAAAFASAGSVNDSTAAVSAVDYNTAKVEINVGTTDLGETANLVVWATDSTGKVVPQSEVSFDGVTGTTVQVENWNEGIVLNKPSVAGKVSVEATFASSGSYTLHAALNEQTASEFSALQEIGSGTAFVAYPAEANASEYGVIKNGEVQSEVTVATNTDLTTTFKINDRNGDKTNNALNDVKVWVIDNSTNKVTKLAKVTTEDGSVITAGDQGGYTIGTVENDDTLTLQFGVAGSYTIYAGTGYDVAEAQKNILKGATTVTVTDETVVDSMKVTANVDGKTKTLDFDDTNTAVLNIADVNKDFAYDGIDTITLNGVAYEEDGTVAKNQTINFDTTKSTVVELKNTTDNTENDGKFSVAFTMSDKSNAVITMTDEASGLEYAVRVIAAETTAQNIDRTKTGGYVLAGNDSKYGTTTYGNASAAAPVLFTDAVQFAVTDEKGEAVTGVDLSDAKIDVRSVADGSTLEAGDLALVWDEANGVYTLGYTGQGATKANGYAKDLIPGKYEVRVALASGDNATVTFNVAKFGKVEDMVVDMTAENYFDGQQKPTDGVHAITDEVTLGQKVTVTAKYVDANGLKVNVPATDKLEYGFDGKAVREYNTTDGVFYTAYDTPSNESLLGTAIHVKVFNQANKQLVEQDLTVVDSYNTYSLEFDPTNGPINEDNKVAVKVVDEDGNVAKVNGTVTAFVADQSDADAKVSVEVADNAVSNGKAALSVYSDRETTAEIAVVVKAGSAMYVGNLEYTFGTEDPLANRTVVMTIGSTEYVVNNKIVTGDAAPFVDSNWRTMVPLRALAESFDAEVNWDNDARTVTINYDANTQIVMTIGEETYTVNGEEMTMDTAPVIQGDRTYVPIRFAAQGMGFSVTPLYDSNGLTASVVFQK